MTEHTFKNVANDPDFMLLISDDEYCPMDFEKFEAKLNDVEESFNSSTTEKGRTLEDLGVYLLDCIIPFDVSYDEKTPMNQLDGLIEVLSFNGHNPFIAEIGRFFVAECKNENKAVGITHVSKVQNILSKHHLNLAIIFSRKQITGSGKFEDAQAEVITTFRGNGKRIMCITFAELKAICVNKINFLSYLKDKEKQLRFFKVENNKLSTELKKYADLKKEGYLTEKEFDSIKKVLIESYSDLNEEAQ
ncbi:hypothetical protein ACUIJN_22720 [Metabacillus halosaccharovorans]|uniref:hypothetical protein n=1 Tax=Metabacillus halosaccharovorans TaxID=930124 RepID=UPI00403D7E64